MNSLRGKKKKKIKTYWSQRTKWTIHLFSITLGRQSSNVIHMWHRRFEQQKTVLCIGNYMYSVLQRTLLCVAPE